MATRGRVTSASASPTSTGRSAGRQVGRGTDLIQASAARPPTTETAASATANHGGAGEGQPRAPDLASEKDDARRMSGDQRVVPLNASSSDSLRLVTAISRINGLLNFG